MTRTLGVSPKAVLAALAPLIAGLIGVGVQWVATGEFDRSELATAISTGVASITAFLGAYLGKPGAVARVIAPEDQLTRPPA